MKVEADKDGDDEQMAQLSRSEGEVLSCLIPEGFADSDHLSPYICNLGQGRALMLISSLGVGRRIIRSANLNRVEMTE